MLDHMGFGVSDYEKAKAFYSAVLAPLGASMLIEVGAEGNPSGAPACGFGRDHNPDFWIGGEGKTTPRAHIAFTAQTRAQVDEFYKAALANGATDNGPPGLRTQYPGHYYAAFVFDLDGHNIEAVCHAAE